MTLIKVIRILQDIVSKTNVLFNPIDGKMKNGIAARAADAIFSSPANYLASRIKNIIASTKR